MKSIMQEYDGTCYLCAKLNGDYRQWQTQEHHCICGTANRRLSEKYGLKVRLCIPHHTGGPEAVHINSGNMRILQKEAQLAFEKKYPSLSFRDIFGINYLTEEDREAANPHESKVGQGFRMLEEDEIAF